MAQLIQSIHEVAGRYDALFCDLWGCLHDGYRPFPEAVEALRRWRRKGKLVMLLTNSPRPRPNVVRQLARIGVPEDCWDDITTSGDAAQAALVAGAVGRKVYHIGPPVDLGFFRDMAEDIAARGRVQVELVPLEEAEGIVCTGLFDDENESPEDYRPTLLAAKVRGLRMLCVNPDIEVDRGTRRIWCAGAICRLYQEMGGEVLYFGKPHAPIYVLARQRLERLAPGGVPDERILCIGDGIHTDIAGAVGEGLDSCFVTGGLAAGRFGPDPDHPDPAALEAFFAEAQLSPTWVIPRLR